MPRYIEADDAIYELERAFPAEDYGKIVRCISRTRTADVQGVKTAKWVHSRRRYRDESDYKCSNCGYQAKLMVAGGHLVGGYGAEAIGAEWVEEKEPDLSPYCPSCGYSMTEGGDEDGSD